MFVGVESTHCFTCSVLDWAAYERHHTSLSNTEYIGMQSIHTHTHTCTHTHFCYIVQSSSYAHHNKVRYCQVSLSEFCLCLSLADHVFQSADQITDLFRFLQLLCEGHNESEQCILSPSSSPPPPSPFSLPTSSLPSPSLPLRPSPPPSPFPLPFLLLSHLSFHFPF